MKCVICEVWFIRRNIIKYSIKYIPKIRNQLNEKIKEALANFKKKQDEYTYEKNLEMPKQGMKIEKINAKTNKLFEFDSKRAPVGKISGCAYYEQDQFNQKVIDFAKQFLYHNLLHFDLYVAVRQMEAELIAMTSNLFHGDINNPYGVTTSGGTESICMAVLAARNYCERYKGITEPELVAACTVHTAFDKACSMLKIKFRKIDFDPVTFQIDLKKMKKALNRKTILIVGSCPNFPHGIIDPIEEMAAIAKQKNILFHVDGCLGSMCLPFANELGQPVPKFGLDLEGVTSISIDHHKHGLAPKGVSAVIYKTAELRRAQYYASLEWPGGAYGTPSIGGSRPGAPVAGAWFAMMHLGQSGYRELAKNIFEALNYLKSKIKEMPEIELIGNPIVNALAFRSTDEKRIRTYSIKKALSIKGWDLTGTQKPPGIHISLTQSFARSVEVFITDVQTAIQEVKSEPEKYATSAEAAIYGSAEMLPVGDITQFRDFVVGLVDITLTLAQQQGYKLLTILIILVICCIIGLLILKSALKLLKCFLYGIFNLKQNVIAFSLNYIPPIRNQLKEKIRKALVEFQQQQDEFTWKKTLRMPDAGIKAETLNEKVKKMLEFDKKKGVYGKISGCRYFEENQLNNQIVEFTKQFLYHNLLHWDMDVSIRQMEAELIALSYDLVNGDMKHPCGVVTQGGSESIFLACMSARNYCRKHKGITEPEIIASRMIHFSFDKACEVLNIKMVKIELDPKTYQIDLNKMKRAITKRTILIAGSSPNYPHGIIDPLEEMAAIAKRRGIFFHVDCCLGSLNMPFARELGQPVPRFDFTLDGVTSISMDHHKHGLSPKGVSVILYKNYEIRHAQYFASMEWPGGGYGLPTIAGSKSGAPIAGAWFAMMHLGKAGYRKCAQKIFNALNYLKHEIGKIPELEIIGDPIVNTIAFKSRDEKTLSSYAIKAAMAEKQWSLTGIQKPFGIHISITQPFANSVKSFIPDLKEAIQLVKNDQKKYNKNIETEMYGTAQALPVGQIQGFYDLIYSMVDITLSV